MKRCLSLIFLSLLLVLVTGCSSFGSRFAHRARTGQSGDRFSGAYSGRWASSSHPGGGGRLWCILTRLEDAACSHPKEPGDSYRAEFRATWHGVFSTEHTVVLKTIGARTGRGSRAASRTFGGTAALKTIIGPGSYRCEGTMDGDRMRACYDASYDRGTFDLKREIVTTAREN